MNNKRFIVVTALLCTAAGIYFSGCDAWMKPLVYSDEEFDSTVAVRIDPNPFSPNVFYQNGYKPQSTEEWQEICGFKLIGSKFNKTEWEIPPQSYTIEDFDNTSTGEDGKIVPVKVYYDDSYNGRLWTEFEIMLLPPGPYYPIKAYGGAYGDEDAHGMAIPVPSSAKTGDIVYVTVSPDADYELVKDSLRLYPPPPPDDSYDITAKLIGKDEDGKYFFEMPYYMEKGIESPEFKLSAGFEKTVAMREDGTEVVYYSSLANAVYAGGTQGVVTVLSNVKVDETIVLNNGEELTIRPKDGAVITIARGSGTASLFAIGGTEQTPSTLKFETGASSFLIVDGGNKAAGAPLINVQANGAFDMSSGVTLQNNQNTGDYLGGGAVCNNGTFTMSGGNIGGNRADDGGGVYNNGTFTMSGDAVVAQDNAVSLIGDAVIKIAGQLSPPGGVSATINVNTNGTIVLRGDGHALTQADCDKFAILNHTESTRKIILDNNNCGIIRDITNMIASRLVNGKPEYYNSITKAIEAVPDYISPSDPDVITVLKNSTIAGTITVNKQIKLTPAAAAGVTITRDSSFTGDLFTIGSGAGLTLGGSITIDGNGDTLEAIGSLVKVSEGSTFTINAGAALKNNRYPGGGTAAAVYVDSGTFYMQGGEISGNEGSSKGGSFGGVCVKGSGTFTMSGGTISGNKATHGGGVSLSSDSGASFTMSGGAITGNTARFCGGGVYVGGTGVFTMNSGEIRGNVCEDGGGGGAYIDDNSEFTMLGGTISRNTASGSNEGDGGGGVFVYDNAMFTMSGGTISVNTASGGDEGGGDGGGVYNNGTFTMTDGAISENPATNNGGGVYNNGTFTMTDGAISENPATNNGGGVYADSDGTFTRKGGTITGNTVTKGNGDDIYSQQQ